ncbi:MAG TPA: phosphoribosylaminoimidazolesuccinocarboxamide synthase [Kiritimatiellia bacterium]|nr:phosphoribosylaminoimidazolesuccinocarboxamide synthase [Kiritimatiellia bacterium]HPS07791.1 phosphoribosylaminoimidazolesuccinocarboxamide synthase [Kiritimatiellia bacterium]
MQYDKNHALLESSIPGMPAPRRGKVRDLYDLGDSLLLVATDRISAFDVIMPNGIPDKGRILNSLSVFWFGLLDGMPNHLITADVDAYPAALQAVKEDLRGRSMLVRKVSIIPFECIVRGYLTGSGWKEYQKSRTVNGQPLREGYQNASKLDAVLFTPSTKAEQGEHDMPVTPAELTHALGQERAEKLADVSTGCYSKAADYAAANGIIIADTKFEFGEDAQGRLVLADEVLTPDSSRFWPRESYAVGSNPPSLDKQFVRDWLDSIHFSHQPPAPVLPDDVVAKTREKYVEAYEKLTKRRFV